MWDLLGSAGVASPAMLRPFCASTMMRSDIMPEISREKLERHSCKC